MEDARTKAARRHFDRWSETYEQDRASRWLRQIQAEALEMLALGHEDVLLDLACGTGAAVRQAAATVARAVGFDLSPAMIARALVLGANLPNVEFLEGDVSGRLPFADCEFTAILCTTAFHHFPRPQDTITEIARVLAPGGRLVIGDANRSQPVVFVLDRLLRALQRSHVGFSSPTRLGAELRTIGFTDVATRTIWSGGYAFIRSDKPG